jgi:hypothetical protein
MIGKTMNLVQLGIADAAVSSDRRELWYVNKEGRFLKATPQAVGFMIKGEKDFLKEFDSEKKYTQETLMKYLEKMNGRYPF